MKRLTCNWHDFSSQSAASIVHISSFQCKQIVFNDFSKVNRFHALRLELVNRLEAMDRLTVARCLSRFGKAIVVAEARR